VLRVALLGDSITLGQACGNGGYEKYLAPALGERHYAVRTFAGNGLAAVAFNASGATDPSAAGFAANYAGRAFVRSQQWLDALAFDADVYVVMLGTNDASTEAWALAGGSAAALLRDYGALLAQLRALPAGPEVLAAVPPPALKNPWGINATLANALLPLQAFPALRAATGVPLIDVFSALGGGSEAGAPFFCDGVHPTKEGAKRIAMAVYEGLWRRLVVRGGWPPFRAREDFFPPSLVWR
jgi:lysophospholipase L1-like esterase